MLTWDAPPLYFMHIPKTAGSSLSRLLVSIYGPRHTVSLKLPHHLARYTLASLRHYRCYTCHFGPGLFDLIGRGGLLRFTILREPTERAISAVYFHQNQIVSRVAHLSPDYLDRMQIWGAADLRALLQVPEFARLAKNSQTRFLGNVRDYRPYLRDGEVGSRNQFPKLPLQDKQRSGHDKSHIFDRARRQLGTMDIVGVTERMDETLELLCGRLGVPHPTQMPLDKINPRKRGVDVDYYRCTTPPDLVEMVEAWTANDRELYALANEMLDRQLAELRAQKRRLYSLAPRLRMQIGQTRQWLKQTSWPGIALRRILQRVRALAGRRLG